MQRFMHIAYMHACMCLYVFMYAHMCIYAYTYVNQSIKSSFIHTTFDINAEGFTRAWKSP